MAAQASTRPYPVQRCHLPISVWDGDAGATQHPGEGQLTGEAPQALNVRCGNEREVLAQRCGPGIRVSHEPVELVHPSDKALRWPSAPAAAITRSHSPAWRTRAVLSALTFTSRRPRETSRSSRSAATAKSFPKAAPGSWEGLAPTTAASAGPRARGVRPRDHMHPALRGVSPPRTGVGTTLIMRLSFTSRSGSSASHPSAARTAPDVRACHLARSSEPCRAGARPALGRASAPGPSASRLAGCEHGER